ncbi:NAD-dependent epimerase/dehydratase family protein [Nocardioides sp. AX2bis]|uniref:NAD-dependent epimerase/dehydratase family protein n=1 Tax=Nocardioides sp. AX2bis TaxID=2653157 RepID=UPI0012F09B7A|nr:NAD-dependent epimerase/dehydratase family protein [Nocardioides sp. AX2bis]VXB28629.1 Epimerase [Nocardioides sp. AX2bis]
MRVVVTGATGNVGTAVLEHLLATRDDLEVVGLARRVPAATADDAYPGRLTWAGLDLSDDACLPALRVALRGADAVVHLAWGFQPSRDPDYLEALGVGGTRRVLESATAEQVPHLVHMSSVGAYSPRTDDVPVGEDFPTHGIRSSMYSRHKAAAEALLDEHDAAVATGRVTGPSVARLRPGIVGQRDAGSALLRYGLPGLVPGRAVTLLPVLPLDRSLLVPMVHAADVADAVGRVLDQRATGAFNLAAPTPVTAIDIASALGARHVHAPGRLLRAAVSASWQAHVQPLDPGWIDLALEVPLMDTRRAREELGWSASRTAVSVLEETVAGMRDSAAGSTAALRPRSVVRNLRDRLGSGPVAGRRRP